MKICMLIDSLVRGGRERRLIELLKDLKNQQHIELCMILFSGRIEYPEVHELCDRIHILERKPAKDPRVFLKLYNICRSEQPDVLHCWGWMSAIYAVPSAKLLGIPLLNAAITDAPADMGWLDNRYFRARLTFPFSNIVAGNSLAGLQVYHAPADRCYCLYNGFDFKRIQNLEPPEIVRKKLGIATRNVIGMVAAFHQRKDYDTFMKVATHILKSHDEVTFIAIGNGPKLEHYRKQIPENYKHRILMPGMMQQAESIINIFDIGMLCSFTEGISNSIMEYMALAKPVVASSHGGTCELVEDGVTGYLQSVGDWQAISKRISELLADENLCAEMGRNGKTRIEEYFSLDKMGQAYLELYNLLVPNKITATI